MAFERHRINQSDWEFVSCPTMVHQSDLEFVSCPTMVHHCFILTCPLGLELTKISFQTPESIKFYSKALLIKSSLCFV